MEIELNAVNINSEDGDELQEVIEQPEPVVEEPSIELPEAPQTLNELKNVHKILGEAKRGLNLD